MQHLSDCTRDRDEACCCPENLKYEVVEYRNPGGGALTGDWVAEAINYEGEGEIYAALFSGYDAEARAKEYADWKNSGSPKRTPPLSADAFPHGRGA